MAVQDAIPAPCTGHDSLCDSITGADGRLQEIIGVNINLQAHAGNKADTFQP